MEARTNTPEMVPDKKPVNKTTKNPGRKPTSKPAGLTPMMAQFLEIKAAHPDCLLFYRMGDFYELFFEDAEIASQALGITLTKRGKHLGQDISMCGVPHHSSDQYLQRLIRQGYKVAVCEQTEDPAEAKKRGAKSVVRREVVRLVTPGTLTEDNLLEAKQHNFLACLTRLRARDDMALAWVDISTGEFFVANTSPQRLPAELARLAPREIIFPESFLNDKTLNETLLEAGAALAPLPASRLASDAGERTLKQHFQVGALEGFGDFSRAEIAACGGLVDYVLITQVGKLPTISPPKKQSSDQVMLIDVATRTNLELTKTLSGERQGSLLATMDMTVTGPGGRLLSEFLSSPLAREDEINRRLDAVSFFHQSSDMRHNVRDALKNCPDLGRAMSRLSLDRGNARDLAAIARGLETAGELARLLTTSGGLEARPDIIDEFCQDLSLDVLDIVEQLAAALDDDLPQLVREGGFIRAGFSEELDKNRRLRDESRQVIAQLQEQYRNDTSIKSLKIKHNNVLGYFIDVPAQYGELLTSEPHNQHFIHRQTLANAMRFTTTRLGELEQEIQTAGARAVALELEIFADLVELVCGRAEVISRFSYAIAQVDVFSSLAELAEQRRYVRPRVDNSLAFEISAGRHPVVEAALKKSGQSEFIVNDCHLSGLEPGMRDPAPENEAAPPHAIILLTGPNMAGKSTYLRQNALIALMAQMGSFVPAGKAHIGIVDRLFSRVGAADDLARGRSTFMVEMVETATILNQASERSLVILDEIGRGTSTFDGLSIAWGCVEHLHDVNKCRALFATHFHELTKLAARMPLIGNATMKVREWKGDVIFLHEVGPGAADRSYGIQVAKLAGLPPAVIARASQVLEMLEKNRDRAGSGGNADEIMDDLPLFTATPPQNQQATPARPNKAIKALQELLPDEMTPRDALETLYQLKALCDDENG